jgi:lysophospholipase L1-like esterase
MLKKILVGLAVVVAVMIVVEVIALLMLRNDLRSFTRYWQERAGQTSQGEGEEFVYVALGDSAAQGIGASAPEKGYVGLLAEAIGRETGRPVRVVNLSVSGAKIQDLLDRQLPQLQRYQPDLITMEIGANDIRGYQSATFRREFQQVLDALPADRTVVSTMPFFGGRIRTEDKAYLASEGIQELAKAKGFSVAELYVALEKSHDQREWIYAADFFHPNDKGYRIWYEAFWPPVRDKL